MAELFISIKESARLSGKSIQTIRRAIKNKKLACKRKKTPQGFNYLVKKSSLIKLYELKGEDDSKKKSSKSVSTEFARIDDLKKVQNDINALVREHKKVEQSLVRFMQSLQDKFVALENQFKLLEEPNEKRWYQFWK